MQLWISLLALAISAATLYFLVRGRGVRASNNTTVPDHVWLQLRNSLPEADYNYLRATAAYMKGSPSDLVARLNHIGAVGADSDPHQTRVSILELRLADIQSEIEELRKSFPSESHIAWIAVASVSTVASLVALVFYLLQQGFLSQSGV